MNPSTIASYAFEQVPELIPIALMIVIPIAAIFALLRYRTGRMRLNLQATARLYKKVANESLGDQMSTATAFGFIMHPRVLKIARERDDPLAFINSFKRARRYVRYDNGQIVSMRASAPLSFKALADLLRLGSVTLLFVPWIALVIHPWLHFSPNVQTVIVLTQVVMWFVTPAALWLADDLMHAHWLTTKFNERYPAASGAPPLVPITSAKRTTKSASKREEKRALPPSE